jgi:2-dehydro-3-deoxyphosphogalactonate aldolase
VIDLKYALDSNPLIAILRGLEPQNAEPVADVLVDAGFQIIEVPLNSPRPFDSISKIAERHGANAIVGAGTVLTVPDVHSVADAGGQVIVSPNMNPDVGRAAIDRGLYWCPGVITPTEAFAALEIGAAVLKIFPAEMVPPSAVAALRAVLPVDTFVAVVGGISPDNMKPYWNVGTNGFGLGSALFKPSYRVEEIAARAQAFIKAIKELA